MGTPQPSPPRMSRRPEVLGPMVRRLLRRNAGGRLTKTLGKIRPGDVAVMLRGFTPSEQLAVFRVLIKDFPEATIDVLTELEPELRVSILEKLSPQQVASFVEMAAVDDAIFLLDSLPPDLSEKVREIVDLEERFSEVQTHLAYEDDSAGRIMETDFFALDLETTVAEAIAGVRSKADDIDMISYLYVVDAQGGLLGVVSLRQLLLSSPESSLGEIMIDSVIKVHTHTDQEEVAQLAARYDLLAIPVVDDDASLVGIVTVDDILDIFKDEATEDFYKMAGTSDDEMVYQDRSFKVASIRLPWILFNLCGLLLAALATGRFESTFDRTLLIAFIPVIMGMAGNIGSQTSTIAVRGLATGRLAMGQGHIRQFLWQQAKVGLLLAIACSTLVAVVALVAGRDTTPALAIGLSLFATVMLASLNGVLIPVGFQRLGVDPAVAAGPLVTTLNDVLGILLYFGLTIFLLQTLPQMLG